MLSNHYRMKPRATLVTLIACVFILVFTYTGSSKLLAIDTFQQQLLASPGLGAVAYGTSWTIPLCELFVATLLVFPSSRYVGLVSSMILMIGFTTYIAAMILGVDKLPCACGGILTMLTWKQHLWLNGVLTVLAAIGVYAEHKNLFAIKQDMPKT
jgi:hypothetical protein